MNKRSFFPESIAFLFFMALVIPAKLTSANFNSGLKSYSIKTNLRDPVEIIGLSRWLSKHEFDIAGTSWRDGEIEVITDDNGFELLSSFGLDAKITELQHRKHFVPDQRYLNPASLAQKMNQLVSQYPHLTRLETIGTTIQGRPILAMLISKTPTAGDVRNLEKPAIIFDAEHHAREVMTPEIVMDVATTLLSKYGNDSKITQLVQDLNVWIVPMVNPDGSHLVFNGKNMWRKNAHESNGQIFGVDINRNYSYNWNSCRGSSGHPWAQTYRGESAASEPETRALINLANTVRPAAYLSYHSYSELVLYPYGCTGSLTPENTMVERVANQLAKLLPSDSGNGHYTPGSSWGLLYDVDGDSMGYMYANFGALSYTFEVNRDFQPSYSLRDPTVAKHRKAWLHFLGYVRQNLLRLQIVDARTNTGSETVIEIDQIAHLQNEQPFKTNHHGYFFKVLDHGRYNISARLPDGRSEQVVVEMTSEPKHVKITIN